MHDVVEEVDLSVLACCVAVVVVLGVVVFDVCDWFVKHEEKVWGRCLVVCWCG